MPITKYIGPALGDLLRLNATEHMNINTTILIKCFILFLLNCYKITPTEDVVLIQMFHLSS